MAKRTFPLAKSLIPTPQEWSLVAQNWLDTGVIKGKLNELQVYADSTGMQVKIKSGQAYLQGHFFQSDTEEVLPIAAANATNPRIDRVIIRVDWLADTLDIAILQGTPAISPIAPALTQNSSRWEISLAQVRVNAVVSSITADKITDERAIVKNSNENQEDWINAVLQNLWTTNDSTPVAYFKDDFGLVYIRGSITGGSTANGTVLFTLPVGYRPQFKQHYMIPAYTNTTLTPCEICVNTNGTVTINSGVGVYYPHLYLPPFRAYQ